MSRVKKSTKKKTSKKKPSAKPTSPAKTKSSAKKRATKKQSASAKAKAATKKAATKKAATKKAATKKPATKKPATKKASTKKASTKKASTKKASTKKASTKKPSTKKASTKKPSTKKPSTKKPSTKKASTKKPSTKKASTKKPSTKKASAKKPSTKKASAKKASAKKASAKKASTKKASTKKASTKKASTKKASTKKPSTKKASTKKASTKKASTKKASTKKASGGLVFAGFPKEGLQFLAELGLNNEREWFQANKHRYEGLVLEPALAFIRAMAPRLAKISKEFKAVDKKVGGSLMRIYRDVRFSKDKSPYKTNIGIQFRHVGGKDVHAPGFYVHIEPGDAFIGCGMWKPDAEPLDAVRRAIADTPDKWQKVIGAKAFNEHFELQGDSLVRAPKGFDPEHPMIDDLRRKDHIAVTSVPVGSLSDAALVDLVSDRFEAVAPYVRFLCDAVGTAF